MATTTLERPKPDITTPEWPTVADFRSKSPDSEDLTLLFDTVDAEDTRRARQARRLALVHHAIDLNTDIGLIRDEILKDAEVELRVWVNNLAATLDANAERIASPLAAIEETGYAVDGLSDLLESAFDGESLAHRLLISVAGQATL